MEQKGSGGLMKWRSVFISSLVSVTLLGCNNKGLESEIDRVEALKKDLEKEIQAQEKVEEERMEAYQEMERPLDEILENIDKEDMRVLESKEIKDLILEKETFTSEVEFSKAVAFATYNFFSMKWNPEEYYEFLSKQSTTYYKENVLDNKKQALQVFGNVQGILKEQKGLIPVDYEVTEVVLDKNGNSGYFYRKDTLAKGDEAFYIISIVKEGDSWKFESESPSAPYEKIDDNVKEEKEEESPENTDAPKETEEDVENEHGEE